MGSSKKADVSNPPQADWSKADRQTRTEVCV